MLPRLLVDLLRSDGRKLEDHLVSYFVEALTATLEEEAESYFKRIDELGGVIPAIERGFFQREIAEAAYRYQEDLEAHRRVMVG